MNYGPIYCYSISKAQHQNENFDHIWNILLVDLKIFSCCLEFFVELSFQILEVRLSEKKKAPCQQNLGADLLHELFFIKEVKKPRSKERQTFVVMLKCEISGTPVSQIQIKRAPPYLSRNYKISRRTFSTLSNLPRNSLRAGHIRHCEDL